MMLRIGFSVVLFMMTLVTRLSAEDAPTFKTVIIPDSIRFVQAFSQDKQVGTMIFDNFGVGTEIGRGRLPSVETIKFTYVLTPVSKSEVSVTQQIRGFVSTQGSGSASLVIHSAGETTLVDLSKAIAAAGRGEKSLTQTHKEAKILFDDSGLTVSGRPTESKDFLVEFHRKVGAGIPLQTTVGVLVDRLPGDDGSSAMMQVDSVDFHVTAVKAK